MLLGSSRDLSGEIRVRLGVDDGYVNAVELVSTRPEHAASVLIGRAPQHGAAMVGMLFALCSRAQTIASLQALEVALCQSADGANNAVRTIMRLAEMLTQTAMRICLDWPRLLDVAENPAVVRTCLNAEAQLEQALTGGADWKRLGGGAVDPDSVRVKAIIAELSAAIGTVFAHDGLAGQLRAGLAAKGLQGFGAVHDGDGVEDGALVRRWDEPDVQAARLAYGAGMLARLEARFADMIVLPQALGDVARVLSAGQASHPSDREMGSGEASVETARGTLKHRVSVNDGVIATYDILAPTDANFAPNGPVTSGLMGVRCEDEGSLMRAAELHVLAIDPCVKCRVEMGNA